MKLQTEFLNELIEVKTDDDFETLLSTKDYLSEIKGVVDDLKWKGKSDKKLLTREFIIYFVQIIVSNFFFDTLNNFTYMRTSLLQ